VNVLFFVLVVILCFRLCAIYDNFVSFISFHYFETISNSLAFWRAAFVLFAFSFFSLFNLYYFHLKI